MDTNKSGGLNANLSQEDILALEPASDAASDSPTEDNTQNNIQPTEDTPTEPSDNEVPELSDDPQKSEPKSESDPDKELLETLEKFKSDIPIGKIKRVQDLIRQKNELKQSLEAALKTTGTPAQANEPATKPITQDNTKYSSDFDRSFISLT